MKNANVRSAAAAASAASAPAAIAASHQPRLLSSMNRRPSSDAGNADAACGSTRRARDEVLREPEEREVPADSDRTRPELCPVVVHMRDVLELESGSAPGRLAETQLDPAHLPAVLPGRREAAGRLATLDETARVALHLVAAPSRSSPDTGRNHRGIRSGLVQASHTSSSGAS